MAMDRDRSMPLRMVEFHILLSLAAGERHGYGIIQDIEARGETACPTWARCTGRWRAWWRTGSSRRRPAGRRRTRATSGATTTASRVAGLRVARAEARRLEALTRAARIGGLLTKVTK